MAPNDVPSPSAPAQKALERLRAIAAGAGDREFGERLRKVFEEGGRAIERLGTLSLDRYDELADMGSPDLSMWEKLAPVIRDTLMDINRLLSTVREQFPAEAHSIGDLIGDVLDGAQAGSGPEARSRLHQSEATEQIQRLGNMIAAEVSNLGERMRSPQVVSDHWNLLADLQDFRGKFRTLVGDLLYLSSSAFAPVSRTEVIPSYAEDLAESIAARRAVTDVARLMHVHATRMAAAQEPQVAEFVAALTKDLDAFGRSHPFGLLRAQDKRPFVEFRTQLRGFPGSLARRELQSALEQFAQFTQGLSGINRRPILVEHDHERVAQCAVMLENVEQQRASDFTSALFLFADAVGKAQALYGRSPSLDAYLRRAKKRDLTGLSPETLAAEVEMLRGLLVAATAL
ncbi:MAG TPA: hypothetical protein VGK67_21740 [Myxococcales bacterium]|jgi:hypothetical protein